MFEFSLSCQGIHGEEMKSYWYGRAKDAAKLVLGLPTSNHLPSIKFGVVCLKLDRRLHFLFVLVAATVMTVLGNGLNTGLAPVQVFLLWLRCCHMV